MEGFGVDVGEKRMESVVVFAAVLAVASAAPEKQNDTGEAIIFVCLEVNFTRFYLSEKPKFNSQNLFPKALKFRIYLV